jgi:hypothetical protein
MHMAAQEEPSEDETVPEQPGEEAYSSDHKKACKPEERPRKSSTSAKNVRLRNTILRMFITRAAATPLASECRPALQAVCSG